jgi:hypothetical protein
VRGDAALQPPEGTVTIEDYRRALEAAVREYEELGERRRDIDKRLAEVAQTIGTLSRLCGLTPTVPMGLTDACRLVVRGAGVPMTPPDVRDRLQAIGVDLSKYVNDLAAIHTVLKRLNEAGELRFIARGTGKQAFVWNRPARAAALGPDIAAFMRESMLEREALAATEEPVPSRPKARRAKATKRPV